jgi:tripartite-type tricarboxylate transporter receptor subunit TctC
LTWRRFRFDIRRPQREEINMKRRALLTAIGLALVASAASAPASAQSYPNRPITLIVPWAAGGGADLVSRLIGAGLEKELGQPVNVVNRTGGGGVTGHSAIQTAPADGYTIGVATSEIATYKVIGLADMTPDSFDIISRIVTIPSGITVKADGPYKTAADVIAALKSSQKGALSASGTGPGGAWHLALTGMAKAAGVTADHVKYVPSQGGAPALQELTAGGLSFLTVSPIEAKALSDGGKVKVVAVMDSQRMPSFPDAPTLKEATGLDYTFVNWFALTLPKGVPADVRARIAEAAQKAHARPDVQTPMKERGIAPVWETSEQSRTFAAKFAETAGGLLKDLGLAK